MEESRPQSPDEEAATKKASQPELVSRMLRPRGSKETLTTADIPTASPVGTPRSFRNERTSPQAIKPARVPKFRQFPEGASKAGTDPAPSGEVFRPDRGNYSDEGKSERTHQKSRRRSSDYGKRSRSRKFRRFSPVLVLVLAVAAIAVIVLLAITRK